MRLSAIARSIVGLLLPALLLFLSAGTLAWPQAWVFLALFLGCSVAISLWLRRADPDLFAERTKSPFSADQRLGDRLLMAALFLCFAAWLVFLGLDARFGWSRTPPWAQALGAALILMAFWGWMLVLRVNSFASVTVRVQQERGQTVISSGPYAIVRHPMYSFALLFMLGVPLLLGSFWGLLGLVLFVPLLAARALGEEAVLTRGLPGYRAYADKVRFRLLPGIW
jgi:protein-S-isoprenylcysteine O-methyltransferase Ste14